MKYNYALIFAIKPAPLFTPSSPPDMLIIKHLTFSQQRTEQGFFFAVHSSHTLLRSHNIPRISYRSYAI